MVCFALCLSAVGRAQTVLQRSHYTATIDAQGNLASLKIGGVETLQKPLEFCPGITWTVAKQTLNTGLVTSEAHYTLHSNRGDGQIDYRFEPEQVSVTLTHSLGGFQAWNLTVSPDVLAVENLQNNGVTGAEAIQYREHGEIQATPVVGMSRAQRTQLYLRNGGKVLFWHDGWGAPFNLDEMGTFREYAYRRNLLENKKPMLLRWEIETASAQTAAARTRVSAFR